MPLIAIVDDDADVRGVLCRAFERAGFLPVPCAGPDQALRIVRTCCPDVLLVDLMMPEMTGAELARRLREEPRLSHAVIVLMTGAVKDADQSEAVVAGLEAGANDYLFKPLDLAETVARVRAWLKVKRVGDEAAGRERVAGQALRDEQAWSRAVIASMVDALLVVSGNDVIRICNQRALELLGCRDEELVGRPLGAIFADGADGPDREPARLRRALGRGEIHDYDAILKRCDGGTVPVSLSCALLPPVGAAVPEMVLVVRDITDRVHLQEEQRQHARQMEDEARRAQDYAQVVLRAAGPQGTLVGRGAAHGRICKFVSDAAGAPSPVLLLGASGTGKEVVARAIHANSPRAEKPFVVMDCAALQGSLLESELFGHQKGAFTGATEAKAGLMEVADGGTLFVDEVGEMPLELQSKLLRVLERGEYRRVGSVLDEKVDIRVIAATNRDLAAEVRRRRFRADLYFRLNVLSIVLPPLRERPEDISLLARHFLQNSRITLKGRKHFPADTLRCLEAYEWPGNIRELANVVERAIILSGTQAALRPEHLPPDIRSASRHPAQGLRGRSLEEVEKEAIVAALNASGGHKTRAAAILGIARVTLREKIAKYGLHQAVGRRPVGAGAKNSG
ncbi:MAG TPA: sigma 54-interacting transcriptional regulator [Planctomycetota bacterium]|nr:sigma 54-interacting transcriptional regulator [Planctomycetota bacterium]